MATLAKGSHDSKEGDSVRRSPRVLAVGLLAYRRAPRSAAAVASLTWGDERTSVTVQTIEDFTKISLPSFLPSFPLSLLRRRLPKEGGRPLRRVSAAALVGAVVIER